MIAALVLAVFLPSCAVVDVDTNRATWAGGVATYADRGDGVEYDRGVPEIVRQLVETRQGTGLRMGCER